MALFLISLSARYAIINPMKKAIPPLKTSMYPTHIDINSGRVSGRFVVSSPPFAENLL